MIDFATKDKMMKAWFGDYRHLVIPEPHEALSQYCRYSDFAIEKVENIAGFTEYDMYDIVIEQCDKSLKAIHEERRQSPVAICFFSRPDKDGIHYLVGWQAWTDKRV